jgi:trehalose/maltose transport system permease protein
VTTARPEKKRRGGLLREEFGIPERRTAYFMVLPALLIILVVAIFHILQAINLACARLPSP